MREPGASSGIALLFPGQGAQHPRMLDDLEALPGADAILRRAAIVLEPGFREGVRSGALLGSTVGAQTATVVAAVAAAAALADAGVKAEFAAGQSVGAYAAAVTANALDLETALALVSERAMRMMHAFPAGYGLAAIVGLPELVVREIIEGPGTLWIANYNAPGQFVIAGPRAVLECAAAEALARGAGRAVILDVAVPSHGPPLERVAGELRVALDAAAFAPPRLTMIGASSARALVRANDVRAELARELRVAQRWHDATEALHERGARLFVQCGPGDALSELAAAAFPAARAVAFERAGTQGIAALAARR